MSTLYKLTDQLMELIDMAQELEPESEIDPQVLNDTFEALEGEYEIKAEAWAKAMKELEGLAAMRKAEGDRLIKSARSLKNSADRMKKYMQASMQFTGKTKFKTDLFNFSIRKNAESVKIDNLDKVPAEFWKEVPHKEEWVNKTMIKDLLQNTTVEVDFAHLEQTESLIIK